MNILWLLILALLCFWLAYRYYAGYIAAKFGIHPRKKLRLSKKIMVLILYRPACRDFLRIITRPLPEPDRL